MRMITHPAEPSCIYSALRDLRISTLSLCWIVTESSPPLSILLTLQMAKGDDPVSSPGPPHW